MPEKAIGRFLLLFSQCFVVLLIALATMALMREAMYWLLVPGHVPAELIQSDDVWRMRQLGLRFDARSAAIFTIPLVLVSLILFAVKPLWNVTVKLFHFLSGLSFLVVVALGFVNYFYIFIKLVVVIR